MYLLQTFTHYRELTADNKPIEFFSAALKLTAAFPWFYIVFAPKAAQRTAFL